MHLALRLFPPSGKDKYTVAYSMNCVLVSSKGTGQDGVCAEMLGCDALHPVFSILPSLVFHSYILCFTSLHPLFYIITLLFYPGR